MKWFLVFVLSLSGCTSARQATDISELLDVPPMPRSVPPGVTAIVDRPANARTITRYSLSELLEGAQNVSEEDGFLKNIEKLEALVDLHWSQAEPLLREYVNTGPPRVAAFSLARLYLYDSVTGNAAQADSNREKLKSIVENNRALGRARDVAAEALLITEWKGRDEWYLSLSPSPACVISGMVIT